MFPVMFAIGRTSGWIAQWLEMIDDPEQKIARPRQIYTGARALRLRADRRALSYKVDVRDGSNVVKARFETLDEALGELEAALSAIAARTDVAPTKVFHRELAPVQQVAARGSISGAGVRGGVDVRGDGSMEAWTGRWVRALVERRGRESAFRALKRALGPS